MFLNGFMLPKKYGNKEYQTFFCYESSNGLLVIPKKKEKKKKREKKKNISEKEKEVKEDTLCRN